MLAKRAGSRLSLASFRVHACRPRSVHSHVREGLPRGFKLPMSLSSLLVQRELATIRDVEEALARQVLYGGDLATNLLEVAKVSEARLTALLAESYGLLPAPFGELPTVPDEVRGLVSKDQAMEQGILPLGIEGGALVIASSGPLSPEVEQELGFATSRPIAVKIAPIFRIYQAISRDYGTPLVRRHARLLARLATGAVPAAAKSEPDVVSTVTSEPAPPAIEPAPAVEPAPAFEPAPAVDPAPAIEPAPARTIASSIPSPPTVMEPAIARAHAREELSAPAPLAVEEERSPDTRQSEPPLPPLAAEAPKEEPAPLPDTFAAGEARAHKPQTKRRRGPLTFDLAKKEMDEANERDTILDLFFEFSRQFFEYSAIFIVHGDSAEGRDAAGEGASRDKVASLAVPLDAPSVLASVRRAEVPTFAKPEGAGVDAVLFRDLERTGTSAVGLLPIVVRRRVVAVLLGDDGETAVEAHGVKDVSSFGALAGAAFERLIVRKKKGDRLEKKPPVKASVPSVRPDASALGRALGLPSTPAMPAATETPVLVEAPPEVSAPSAPAEVVVARVDHVSEPPPTVADSRRVDLREEPPEPGEAEARAERENAETASGVAETVVPAGPPTEEPHRAPLPREEPPSLPEDPAPITPRVQSVPPPPAKEDGFSLSDPALPPDEPAEIDVPKAPLVPAEITEAPVEAFSQDEEPSFKRVVEVPYPVRSAAAFVAASAETPMAPEVEEIDDGPPISLAVPAHLPPTRSDRPNVLPSVIVDVGDEYADLVDRVVRDSDEKAETKLLHAGQHAMPAILARFPGPVRLDVSALPEGALPRAGECGPVLRLVARQRRVALPFVLTLVDEQDPDRRFWATYLLSELPYVEAIEPAVLALFDSEPRVRLAARTSVRVLGDLYPGFTVERLAKVLAEPNQVLVRRVIALQMLGEVRDPFAVPHLLPRLIDPQVEISAAARASLTLVSRQDFGLHISHWNDWFDQNRGKQRAEWLIDALAHPSSNLRLAALEELVKLTRNAFGYQDDMPKRERERVMQKFRDWWALEGRARYGR